MHELPGLSKQCFVEKNALILALFGQVKKMGWLTVMVHTLNVRVQELEVRLRTDSHNSSKPSADGLFKKP